MMKQCKISRWMLISSLLLLIIEIRLSQLQIITGPNVCGSPLNPDCCQGWKLHPTLQKCIVPTCIQDCGEGYCQRPNLCFCPNDDLFSITGCGENRAEKYGQCNPPCVNGGHCGNGNRCMCPYGFTGLTCEIDFRTGPCFTSYEDTGTCSDHIVGISSSKVLCCATVGYGWGNPCESCATLQMDCPRGYISDKRNGICLDVNECQLFPSLCGNGTCTNMEGKFICEAVGNPLVVSKTDVDYTSGPCFTSDTCSDSIPRLRSTKAVCCATVGRKWGNSCEPCTFRTSCPKGFIDNPETGECLDVNECVLIQDLCSTGTCENTNGSFICEITGTPIYFNKTAMSIQELNQINYQAFMTLLGNIVESAPWITSALWSCRPFESALGLHQNVSNILDEIPLEVKEAVLRSFSNLGEKLAPTDDISLESTRELKAAGFNDISPEERAIVADLNSRYDEKFDFPFVIVARENKINSIINGLNTRMGNSREQEVLVGIREVKKICWYRIAELVT